MFLMPCLSTVSNILAEYCRTAAMDTFIAAKVDRHPTDLAALKVDPVPALPVGTSDR